MRQNTEDAPRKTSRDVGILGKPFEYPVLNPEDIKDRYASKA